MKNRKLLIVALFAAVVVVVLVGIFAADSLIRGNTQALTTGTPIAPEIKGIQTRVKTAAPTASGNLSGMQVPNAVAFVAYSSYSYAGDPVQDTPPQQGFQFTPCTAVRGATPTAQSPSTPAATADAQAAATQAVQAQGAATAEPDFIVLNIIGDESEACYQVGETFLNRQPPFNLAVGITKAIAGQIAIDRANVSNSRIGDIVIDISKFTSDERMRDGRIRSQWLESNKYPQAKLTNIKLVGLPANPYKDGEVLTFQIAGDLVVHGATRPTTFNVTAALTGSTLTGTASTDVKMTDFGFDPPSIAGMLTANNDAHLVLNFVAREPTS